MNTVDVGLLWVTSTLVNCIFTMGTSNVSFEDICRKSWIILHYRKGGKSWIEYCGRWYSTLYHHSVFNCPGLSNSSLYWQPLGPSPWSKICLPSTSSSNDTSSSKSNGISKWSQDHGECRGYNEDQQARYTQYQIYSGLYFSKVGSLPRLPTNPDGLWRAIIGHRCNKYA